MQKRNIQKLSIICIMILITAFFVNLGVVSNYEVEYFPDDAVALSSLIDANNSITIDMNTIAYIDTDIDVASISVMGELHCDPLRTPHSTELKMDTMVIGGVFQCGTKAKPYTKNITFSLKHNANLNPVASPSYRGLIVHMGGKLILTGPKNKSGWRKLNTTAMPGDNYIIVESNLPMVEPTTARSLDYSTDSSNSTMSRSLLDSLQEEYAEPLYPNSNWKVGDKIVIAPTGYNYQEAESFEITGIDDKNPNKFYLDGTIAYQHWGQTQNFSTNSMGEITLDERAEVANLTRNIKIQADESYMAVGEGSGASDQRGGHIMVHHNGKAYIDSVELYKMGQAGVMARYPFHWHWIQDAPGQFIKNSSIHHSFQRCITIHRTNKALVHNNVCYNFKGHGYFLEDGTEVDNIIVKNLAILAKPPSASKVLLDSDNILTDETSGRFPSVSCFWISNPDNIISHNIAAGCHGTGFWNSFESQIHGTGGNIVATPITTNTNIFNYNVAHSCEVGMTWDGAPIGPSVNNPNNPNDRRIQANRYKPQITPTFRGLKAYKNFKTGIYFRASTTVIKHAVVADNGWSFWNGYNQVIKNSAIIGKTDNYSPEMASFFFSQDRNNRFNRTGVVLYDGPFEVHNTDFLNFSRNYEEYTKPNGQRIHSTVIPFTNTGGTSKYINFVSNLNFNPYPYHRIYLADENDWRQRQYLGNSVIRDLDGSFSGTDRPQVVVARRSSGITPQSGCIPADNTFYNYQICPGNYTEGSFVYMRWGGNVSPWATPFITIRNDGVLNYPKTEWGQVGYSANNLFATANDTNYTYRLLPKFNYIQDQGYGTRAAVNSNIETLNSVNPIVEIVGYGKNCYLNKGAVASSSLQALKSADVTSYYSNDDKFYVKLVPERLWSAIVPSNLQMATAFDTVDRHQIFCDNQIIDPYVKGKITEVVRAETQTIIKGWACNFTHNTALSVKLYAYGPTTIVSEPVYSTNKSYSPSSKITRNIFTLLSDQAANKISPAKTAFDCGKFTTGGRNFEFVISNDNLKQFNKHKFYVKGISNTGGEDSYIIGSGLYPVIYTKPTQAFIDKSSGGY